jgi:RimJ/RimL family protein N-acetyltransferase
MPPPLDDSGKPHGAVATASRPRPERAAVFRGAWATLEPLSAAAHAEALWPAAAAAPESWAWLPHGPFPAAAAFRGYLRFAASSADELLWAVRPHGADGEPGAAAGWLGLLDVQPAHAAIELGNIWFPPGLARTGAATEAMFLLLDHAFGLGYRRVAWKCNALNAASRRAAERLGFALDGVLRAHMIVRGQRRDSAYYSLLAEEWPERRAALLAWLHPSNFDADGRARASLRRAGEESG